MKYKVGLISLGCAKNLVDSEMILGMLISSKFDIVNTIEDSDVIVINTCGFIEDSKKESIETILECIGKNKKVIVTGCLVERYKDDLIKSIPEVDLWVSIKEYYKINELIENLLKSDKIQPINPFVRLLSTPHYMAYLRISEGCNNCCAYCAIPLIRGHFISRPLSDIVYEAKNLIMNGVKELVVISQDTTRYGTDLDKPLTIVDLLKELVKISGLYSLRLLYLYPDEISDELIDFIKDNKVIAPYFDIPIQHSSDNVLKRMRRRGSHDSYQALFNKIKSKIPNSILRTTYIVGFPGESDDDFVNLVAFTRKNKFDHLGVFKYSKEDGTLAYTFKDQVNNDLKNGRYKKIMDVQRKIAYDNNKARIGEIMNGIVIGYDENTKFYSLRSYWNAPDGIDGQISFTSSKKHNLGDIVFVKITKVFMYDLMGEETNCN